MPPPSAGAPQQHCPPDTPTATLAQTAYTSGSHLRLTASVRRLRKTIYPTQCGYLHEARDSIVLVLVLVINLRFSWPLGLILAHLSGGKTRDLGRALFGGLCAGKSGIVLPGRSPARGTPKASSGRPLDAAPTRKLR